ncbi:FtsH protease activity modulator HflK [Wenzhouxiangella sp. XN79A]|uniref:FtsH protease activity modulator HflK n=1 Tax=Wenzhouxiangella sp. XN79A TaxID=2724193 RepID=UPI00144A5710|nr:FtsH protease activity modulator HflK [Wenzhouxiangella sp. XN79A]NKI33681.1 FtsH protease activity modulator HflK [Wenzhouxiangella sp. XN79A]
MPWNEPGRGGGNGQDPWKGGDGQRPPDLDEVFANVQKRLKKIIGGGGDGGNEPSGGNKDMGPGFGGILALLLVLAGIWAVWNSIHIIDESERGVVLRFGSYDRTLMPGLNLTLPAPIEAVRTVNVEQVRSIESSSRMLTGDENLIDLGYAVQYRVVDPEKFLFQVQEPEISLQEATDSAIREVVGTNNMDFILEVGRGLIATSAGELLQQIVDRYDSGIEVTQFNLQQVRPPNQVQSAFDDVVRAREDQIRFANEAQAYANQVVPEARGRAARVLEEAQGYRDSLIAQAEGEADRFIAVYDEYIRAPEVTRQRLYLQTLQDLYSTVPKVLLDVENGNNIMYLPLDGLLNGGAAPASSGRSIPPPPLMNSEEQARSTSTQTRGRPGREGR